MLGSATLVAFATTTDSAGARVFYEDVLGLRLLSDDDFALVFDAGGTTLRVVKVQSFTPQPHTVLGWQVDDVQAMAKELAARGVQFERFPGMDQDEVGVWTQAAVAWFKDPDGNLLSISGH